MPFNPDVNQAIEIDGYTYLIAEHPLAPDIPYGQEGRQAIVYQILPRAKAFKQKETRSNMALKVFKPVFRSPALVELCDKLKPLTSIPGLAVCNRQVLTEQDNQKLLTKHPDLTFAMLMPWIQGPTWLDILIEGSEFSKKESLAFSNDLATTLAVMEQNAIAHGDLSSPNLMLPGLLKEEGPVAKTRVELVDVEQLFHSSFDRPDSLPAGSPGYAHRTASSGLWSPDADRFAGAVLIAEILAWCSPDLRASSWGESYFDPGEMHEKSERYFQLIQVLNEFWGNELGQLFEEAWFSNTLTQCPSFSQWQYAIKNVSNPQEAKKTVYVQPASPTHPVLPSSAASTQGEAEALMTLGKRLIDMGDWAGALEAYRYAQDFIRSNEEGILLQNTIDNLHKTVNRMNVSSSSGPQPGAPARSCYLVRDGDEHLQPIPITRELFLIGRGVNADYQEVLPGV